MCGKPIVYLFILRRLHSKPCYQYASDKSGYSAADTPRPNTNPHQRLLTARLDMDELRRFREKFPAWRDADDFDLK